jgi:serine/threonine-protein kinase
VTAGDVRQRIWFEETDGFGYLAGGTVDASDKRFRLDTGGTAYRYYLVWITQLAPDSERAEISEIRLFQKVAA